MVYLCTLLFCIYFMNQMSNSTEIPSFSKNIHTSYYRSEWFINQFARITQFCTWPIVFIVLYAIFRVRIEGKESFKTIQSPFIIVSNHISFYDSFIFRLILGFFTSHLPLRFMAVKKFNSPIMNTLSNLGFIDLVYALFGVFTVVPKKGIDENLKKPIHIIQCGGNVVVYPEGSITYTDTVGPFRNGAALLAQKTGAPILPVSFRYGKQRLFRRAIFVNVGKAHTISKDIPCIEATQTLLNEVNNLFNSGSSR